MDGPLLPNLETMDYKFHPKWFLRLLMLDCLVCFILSFHSFYTRVTNYHNWSLDLQCYIKSTKTTLNAAWCLGIGILIMLIYRTIVSTEMKRYGMTEVGQFIIMPLLALVHLLAAGSHDPTHVPVAIAESYFFPLFQITIGQCAFYTAPCESRLMGLGCVLTLFMYFMDQWSIQYECKEMDPASRVAADINLLILLLWITLATELALTKIKNPTKNLLDRRLKNYSNIKMQKNIKIAT